MNEYEYIEKSRRIIIMNIYCILFRVFYVRADEMIMQMRKSLLYTIRIC